MHASKSLPTAAYYNDLYRFDPANNRWTRLYPSGSAPSPRHMMGFAATPDGSLYVFGGFYMASFIDNQIYGGRYTADEGGERGHDSVG